MNGATSHETQLPQFGGLVPTTISEHALKARDKSNLESLDQQLAELLDEPMPGSGPARMLLVGPDAEVRGTMAEWLKQRRHRCTTAETLQKARSAVANNRFDLVLLDPELPDGDGFELVELIHQATPASRTIIFSRDTTASTATAAIRAGSVDYLLVPIAQDEFNRRIDTAIIRARLDRQRGRRLRQLKSICGELNTARHEISEQVDVLCNDLVGAYREISDQISEVAMATEFRTVLRQELDVEDLLRTTLEYVLTKTGPTNAAVFLPDSHRNYGLGAYVNYECPRESMSTLLDHLCQAVCPQMEDEDQIVSFDDADEFAEWIDMESSLLHGSQVIAFSCRHEQECLGVVVLFRSRTDPFSEELAGTIDTLRTIFAEQLATVIRVHHRARPQWPRKARDDDSDYDEFGFDLGGMAA